MKRPTKKADKTGQGKPRETPINIDTDTLRERVLECLAKHSTTKAAAACAECSDRTIRRYLNDPAFTLALNQSLTTTRKAASMRFGGSVAAAARTISQIMRTGTNEDAIKLKAAESIIAHFEKLSERVAGDELQKLMDEFNELREQVRKITDDQANDNDQ